VWITSRGFSVKRGLDGIAVLAWVMNTLDQKLSAFRFWLERQAPERVRAIGQLPETPGQLQLQRHEKD